MNADGLNGGGGTDGALQFLTPLEVDMLADQIYRKEVKYPYREIIYGLLYTGMKYHELVDFLKNPNWFDRKKKIIHMGDVKRNNRVISHARTIYLSSQGVIYVDNFLRYTKDLPNVNIFSYLLAYWGKKMGKPWIRARVLRNTWSCWLAISYPHYIPKILVSLGFSSSTHLLKCQRRYFSEADLNEIKLRTLGWSGAEG